MDMNRREFLSAAFAAVVAAGPGASLERIARTIPIFQEAPQARQREYLRLIYEVFGPTRSNYPGRMNLLDRTFQDWQTRTGELPPDFAMMPSEPRLPDLLRVEGRRDEARITTLAQWETQRTWIKDQLQHWVFGRFPPPPGNTRATVERSFPEGDATVEHVRLEFGPAHAATLSLEVIRPNGPGPFPAFLTNHPRRRPWVNTAVRRGYLACIYYAIDSYYSTDDDSDPWLEIYPEYDFGALGRWAWGGMRAVDYISSLPYVDPARIAIGGHSRNSKQALLAAAFDERIGAVAPSRGNTADQVPFRFATEMYVSQSLQEMTRDEPYYLHPRARFFSGREDKLPVDQHMALALVAPRGLIMSHAYMEHQGSPIGAELAYRSARTVYDLYGRPENLALYQQPGEHASSVEDVETYFDFFDTVFGRASHPKPVIFSHGHDFTEWQERTGVRVDSGTFAERRPGDFLEGARGSVVTSPRTWQSVRSSIIEDVRWAMGDEPPGIPLPEDGRGRRLVNDGWRGQLFERPVDDLDDIRTDRVQFGDDLRADLYYPTSIRDQNGDEPDVPTVPLLVWLHAYSYNMGYSRHPYWQGLARDGFAVLAFDQIGFGVRAGHSLRFYDRYPNWSLLGKMVSDTRAAIDAATQIRWIDPERVFVTGWALGAKVAMFTAALDDRVKGLVVQNAFAPLRTSRESQGSEAIWHYSHLHGLLPKLGYFIGSEQRLPIDYDEILAAIAPRPAHYIAPLHDRYNPVTEVERAFGAAARVYELLGARNALTMSTPEEFNRAAHGRELAEHLRAMARINS